jgi:hypothetical protein
MRANGGSCVAAFGDFEKASFATAGRPDCNRNNVCRIVEDSHGNEWRQKR